jgi:signal transduction histidine kinase
MYKSVFPSLVFFFLFLNNSLGIAKDPEKEKSILILFSLSSSTPAYAFILDGLRQELTRKLGDSFDLHMEYLETEHYQKGKYPKERFDGYNQKYKDIDLDLLICVGTDIIPTIKKNADYHLLHLPAISIDYDFSTYGIFSDIALNHQTALIGLKVDIDGTMTQALNLFPETSSIYIVCGVSKLDSLFLSVSKKVASKMKSQRKIVFLTDVSMDEVLVKVRQLPKNSIVFVSSFNTDNRMVPYYNHESVSLISKVSNAPVFAYTDMGFGEGAMGGYIISFYKVGRFAGETALKILRGINPNSIKANPKDYYELVFDERILRRWNLENSDRIPGRSRIIYRELTFFGKYKWLIIGGIFIIILQTMLIIKLVKTIRKQKLLVLRLADTENRYTELFREDRILRIGQLTASLTHELNQPLTAILSTSQAGIRFIDSRQFDPVLMKEMFLNIAEDDKRAASILGSVRSMMKLEKREKEKVNLNTLIREIADLYRSKTIEMNFAINIQLPDIPVYVLADPIQIQQVILNLLSNASQAIEKTPGKSSVIAIFETIQDEYVQVSFRDYGRGIDASVMDRLFDPFITTRKDGLGIGLAICRSIIEDHQGKIWAENMPEGGANFSFKLKVSHG